MTTPADVSLLHANALYGLLDPLAGAPWNYERFFGKVTVTDAALTYPYLIVWPAAASRGQVNLAGNLYDSTTITQLTAVGRDVSEVLMMLDQAAALLQGIRPAIAGRLPGQIRQVNTPGPPTETDQSRTPDGQPYYMGVALYSLTSTPAPTS